MAQIQIPFPPLTSFRSDTEVEFLLFLALIGLVFFIFWVAEFTQLMSMEESRFPGPHVRLGWIAAFILLWLIAPFSFAIWKGTMKKRTQGRAAPRNRRPGTDSGH